MNGPLLRILDANLNRAREALRVIEDYARFALDDASLIARLKALRHQLAETTRDLAATAILHRDAAGDVGTTNKTEAELSREGLAHVVTAAGKRLGEALRCIEECLKALDPAAAPNVEGIRYQCYELEQRIARALRPDSLFGGVELCVLVTESLCAGRTWEEIALAAIEGGADAIQLREKDLDSAELLIRARRLVQIAREHGVLSIINDRPDIAALSGADGVHVGQTDLPAVEARKIVGPDRIVGVSTHSLEQARQAELDGADYIGVGPVFPSQTKPRDTLPGLDFARAAAEAVSIPCIAIAGITTDNVRSVMETGVAGVAVSSAVISAPDPAAAARELKRRIGAHLSRSKGRHHQLGPLEGGTDIHVCVSGSATAPASSTVAGVERRHRNLPHWTLEGATYFITFRTASGQLTTDERQLVLDHLRACHGVYYDLFAAVVMPDHVHCILRPKNQIALSRILKGTKGVTARRINQLRGRRGSVWLDESYDRIIRDRDELQEKVQYVLNNPVRAGLARSPMEYIAIFVGLPV